MRRAIYLLVPLFGLLVAQFPRASQSDVDAGTAIRLDLPALTQAAGLVFEGRVTSVTPLVGATGLIETEYRLAVARTFKGQAVDQQDLRLPGGVLANGNGLLMPGMPQIQVGENVILFLTSPSDCGVRMPVGLSQGKFRVETNLAGQKYVSRQHGALTVINPDTGELEESVSAEVFDYAEVIAEIYAAAGTQGNSSGASQGEQR